MPAGFLTDAQRPQLLWERDHAPKPYQRERAAALLKIDAGLPITHVARHGLLRPRQDETLRGWVRRFRKEGLAALTIRPGRGRKPAFSPSLPGASGG